ncbi:uncharacterized protein LOC108665781 [Hyalella azteca]|uniref:Uncharacterized protein LOC108665781 n=1 Tax=Hyalella azteca TaxID=294128 RepID=A0A8B7N3V0_HYAAZ|nr:uncharacterized protein LOC108665781 [Hyalella azteca]
MKLKECLYFVFILLVRESDADASKNVIPTVVRRSANTEGLVCLLVSKRGSFNLDESHHRNRRRGVSDPSNRPKSVTRKLAAAVSEDDKRKTQILQGTNRNLSDFTGDQNYVHHRELGEPIRYMRNVSLNLSVYQNNENEYNGSLAGLTYPFNAPIIQQDEIFDRPPERKSYALHQHHVASREEFSSSTPTNHGSRQVRSKGDQQYPLLRPTAPEQSHRVVQLTRPMVKISLMVVTSSHDLQYDGGEVVVEKQLLRRGMHTLHFKHVIEENEHRLKVLIDKQECEFRSSKPRRSDQYQFLEVRIKLQGPVTFVGNKSCEESSVAGNEGNDASPPSKKPVFIPGVGVDAQPPGEDLPSSDEGETPPSSPDVYPLKAIVNEVVKNRTIMHKIMLNSTVYDSSISISYINNSALVNTAVDNSIVLNSVVQNSTLINSTLQNVNLINCEVINSRTINSNSVNTKVINLLPRNVSRDFGFDPEQDQITFEEFDGSTGGGNNSVKDNDDVGGVDITLMVFGVLGLIVLVIATIGVALLISRRIIKKRKEMLLVRSAVMGSVKSW